MKFSLNKAQTGKIIHDLRAQKNISQDQLAKILEIPRSSVSQIETGVRELSFIEFQKVLALFELSFDEFLSFGKPHNANIKSEKSVNKEIIFDQKKFSQLLLYILEKCGSKPNVGETVLYKLLYFCDFDYFELYEKPLTGMKYRKMQYGPVPDQALYNQVISDMCRIGLIEKVSKPYLNNTIQTRYLNFMEADLSVFGADLDKMIKVADSVIERFSGLSARQIEDCAHRDVPWQVHEFDEEINYGTVFSRTGEFANRDYDAMSEQSSANDVSEQLGEVPEDENKYYLKLLKK